MKNRTAESVILAACRAARKGFKAPGTWGMRTKVRPCGMDSAPVACAVIDLERTCEHPTRRYERLPIFLVSGDSWESCLSQLMDMGELTPEQLAKYLSA